jgi:hypothetical protein
MKFRKTVAELERVAESELEERIREEAGKGEAPVLPPAFWNSLRVRTNERIDRATSGKAITLSWVVRVALPGVVALLSFLIGLHYYSPLPESATVPLASVLEALPSPAVDSLLWASVSVADSVDAEIVHATVFDAASDEIAAYLVDSGAAAEMGAFLDEEDVDAILRSMTKE